MRFISTLLFLFAVFTLASCQVKEAKPKDDLIAGHVPTTNSFTLQAVSARTYVASETINFVVNFPLNMTIDTAGGNPRLRLIIGVSVVYATYSAQSHPRQLHFSYTFSPGQNDLNGITVDALELAGSTLKFSKNGTD